MTHPQPDHALSTEELCVYYACVRMWREDGFAAGSVRTPPPSEMLKQCLLRVADVEGIHVEFREFGTTLCVYATRPRHQ
jgi:hypothetical protein